MSSELNYEVTPATNGKEIANGGGKTKNEEKMERKQNVKLKRKRKQNGTVPWRWALLLLAAGCVLYYCVYLIDNHLPEVVTIQESIKKPNIFCGERSINTLKKITDLGERTTGSYANEVLSPALIIEELAEIKRKADFSQSILYEDQKGQGAFGLKLKYPATNIYYNIKNVIAILEGSSGTHGIVVNCHYDSGPGSVGASDDAINCAIMLELLRVLSNSKVRLKHNIVFLFNGAEECGLMGSHLFLKHRWANNTDIVMNLEAAGLGGRATLFQAGPKNGWILEYYARYAPYPHGQIAGEEIFQSGFIPSDTDFRIFRDFGKMPGLDFAFGRNGYVYHTEYDREEYITGGSHQHLGENLLAVLRELGNAKELEDMEAHSETSMVYYDYLGLFMVRYSFEASIAINIIVVILALCSAAVLIGRLLQWSWLPQSMGPFKKCVPKWRKETKDDEVKITEDTDSEQSSLEIKQDTFGSVCLEIVLAILIRVCSMGLVVGANCLMALFIDGVTPLSMPYYTNIYLIFPYYWCLGLAAYAFLPMLFDIYRERKHPLTLSMRCQLNLVASNIIWALILFVITCASIRSSALIMIQVLFTSVALLIIHLTPLYKTAVAWIWVYLVIHVLPLLFAFSVMLLAYALVIPITGRSGAINGDLFIALLSSILILYTTSFAIPLMTIVRKPWLALISLVAFCFILLAVSLPSDIGKPYNKGPDHPTPQRYSVMHTERLFYNKSNGLRRHDWGYYLQNLDKNNVKTLPAHLKNGMKELQDDCEKEILCGLPHYNSRNILTSGKSLWIPTVAPPTLPVPAGITFNSKECSNDNCTVNLSLKGPDRMTLIFSMRDGVLDSWSLPATIYPALKNWRGNRYIYLLRFAGGENFSNYELSLTFNVTNAFTKEPLLDISLTGNHVHHKDRMTAAFKTFSSELPDFVSLMPWISSVTTYVF